MDNQNRKHGSNTGHPYLTRTTDLVKYTLLICYRVHNVIQLLHHFHDISLEAEEQIRSF